MEHNQTLTIDLFRFFVFLSLVCNLIPVFFGFYFYHLGFSMLHVTILGLIIHFISVLPIQFLLNIQGKWDRFESSGLFQHWYVFHPKMLKHFSLALIYPYIFVIILIQIRYNNLGKVVTIDFSFETLLFILSLIIIIFCTWTTVQKIYPAFLILPEYFWSKTSTFIYTIYLFCLQNKFFFIIMKRIHKMHFYFVQSVYLKSEIHWSFDYNKDYNYFRIVLNYIVNNPLIFPCTLILFCLFEFIIFQQIYYFFYLLYNYFILFLIWKMFLKLGNTAFYDDCSLSDYVYRNFTNPRYPEDLLMGIGKPELFFKFTLDLSDEEISAIEELKFKIKPFKLRKKTISYIHFNQLFKKVNKKKYAIHVRIAAYYKHIWHNIF